MHRRRVPAFHTVRSSPAVRFSLPRLARVAGFALAVLCAPWLGAQSTCEPPDTSGEPPVELFFDTAHREQQAVIARPGTWDYQATAIRDGDEVQVWYCGGTSVGQGETIHRAMLSDTGANDPIQAVLPIPGTLPVARWDSRHHCSPSVIQHAHHAIYGGQELYYLYYECVAKMWDRTAGNFGEPPFAQICLAASFDGVNFLVYNKDLFASSRVFGDPQTVGPTPVVTAADLIYDRCQYAFENGRHTVTFAPGECGPSALFTNYGSGHPSAVTIPSLNGGRQIWLYYYDSAGDPSLRGVYLRKSWDGFHFQDPIRTNLKTGNIKYFPNLVIDGQEGVFISQTTLFTDAYYEYSLDGVTFREVRLQNSPNGFPPREDLRLAEARPDLCMAPGASTVVGDGLGHVQDSRVEILSAEGYRAAQIQSKCPPHANITPHPCPLPPGESLGTTWDLYRIEGDFNVNDVLDGADLSVDGSVIYHYQDRVLYQYDCVDASCVESFLVFNRFDPDSYRQITQSELDDLLAQYPLSSAMRPGRYDLRTKNFKRPDGLGGRFYLDWQGRYYSYQNWSSYVACNADTNDFELLTPAQLSKFQTDYQADFQGHRSCS